MLFSNFNKMPRDKVVYNQILHYCTNFQSVYVGGTGARQLKYVRIKIVVKNLHIELFSYHSVGNTNINVLVNTIMGLFVNILLSY